MNGWFLLSYVFMWLLLVALFLLVLALVRQIGLIHRRIAPAYGARMDAQGPALGEIAPPLGAQDLAGNKVRLGYLEGKKTLLVFVSASCVACDEVAPALRSIARSERTSTKMILVNDGSSAGANAFIRKHNLREIPMIASQTLREQYGVHGSPYALLIDEMGRVQTKGIVNGLEQLESLVRAHELHIDSLESFVERVAVEEVASDGRGGSGG